MRPETERLPMTAAPSLDEDRLQRLSDLLDRRAVPFGGFNLEALDGYLSALMVGPEDIPPSEWQVGIFGDKPPRWENAEEAADVESLLMGHWNLVAARVRQSEPKAEYLYPLIWMPETEEAEDPESLQIGHDWALGFLRGLELRKAAWDIWIESEEWILDAYIDLVSLVTGKALAEIAEGGETASTVDDSHSSADLARLDGDARTEHRDASAHDDSEDGAGEAGPPLSYDERMEIVADLPWLLIDLHVHRIEMMTPREPIRREPAPGRNDPCPCGSGKKYKKCHG